LPDLNNQRAFARAVATRDEHVMAGFICDQILPPDSVGEREIRAANEAAKQKELVACMEPSGLGGRPDGVAVGGS
jgi:hypothetical protein